MKYHDRDQELQIQPIRSSLNTAGLFTGIQYHIFADFEVFYQIYSGQAAIAVRIKWNRKIGATLGIAACLRLAGITVPIIV